MDSVFVEQKNFFDFICNEIEKNKISHSYLIETCGYEHVDLLIKEFVKLLICDKKKNNWQCKCKLCNLIDENMYPDVKYVSPDGIYIKKEQLMEVKNYFKNKSFYGNKLIYIINDATKLNASSANTILKFLEEPEENIIAILVADSRYKVIDTIISRCQIISLSRNISNEFSNEIVEISNLLCSKENSFLKYNELISILPDRNIALEKLKKVQEFLFSKIGKNEYLDLSDIQLINIVSSIERVISMFEYNVNYKLVLDDLLVSIMEVIG